MGNSRSAIRRIRLRSPFDPVRGYRFRSKENGEEIRKVVWNRSGVDRADGIPIWHRAVGIPRISMVEPRSLAKIASELRFRGSRPSIQ